MYSVEKNDLFFLYVHIAISILAIEGEFSFQNRLKANNRIKKSSFFFWIRYLMEAC